MQAEGDWARRSQGIRRDASTCRGIQHLRQEGVSGDIEEVLLFYREQLPAASGLKVEDLFLGGESLGSSSVHG